MDFSNIKENILKYTKSKRNLLVLTLLITGIVLILLPSGTSAKKENNSEDIKNNEGIYEETRLKKILTSVEGIKDVNVMICYQDKGVKEYYKNKSEDIDDSNIKSDTKIVTTRLDGNEIPVLRREISPEIKGVSIVADCNKKGMKETIYSLTSKALGVEIHKIEVVINDRSR